MMGLAHKSFCPRRLQKTEASSPISCFTVVVLLVAVLAQGCVFVRPLKSISNSLNEMNGKIDALTAAITNMNGQLGLELTALRTNTEGVSAQLKTLSALADAAVPAMTMAILKGGGLAERYNFYLAYCPPNQTAQTNTPSQADTLALAWSNVYSPVLRAAARMTNEAFVTDFQKWYSSATMNAGGAETELAFRDKLAGLLRRCTNVNIAQGTMKTDLVENANALVNDSRFGAEIMTALRRSFGMGEARVQVLVTSNIVTGINFDAGYSDKAWDSAVSLELLRAEFLKPKSDLLKDMSERPTAHTHTFFIRTVPPRRRYPSVVDIVTGKEFPLAIVQGATGSRPEPLAPEIQGQRPDTRQPEPFDMSLRVSIERTGRFAFEGDIVMWPDSTNSVRLAQFLAVPAALDASR
jgi:hypothetical protein